MPFTSIRLASGAAALATLAALGPFAVERGTAPAGGGWRSATALAAYAFGFSIAYLRIPAGVGALALFGAVQSTMIGVGLARGERLGARTWGGLAVALAGLAALAAPGAAAPDPLGLGLMLAAGVAWGVYSLRGRGAADPVGTNAANFLASLPFAALALLVAPAVAPGSLELRPRGVALAVVSGAITSGVGYAVWYRALRGLAATQAAIVQLAVVPLTALGGVALLGERLTPRLVASGVAILGGVLLAVTGAEGDSHLFPSRRSLGRMRQRK